MSLIGLTVSMTTLPAAAETPRQLGDTFITNLSLGEDGIQRCVDDTQPPLNAIHCNWSDNERWHKNQFSDGSYEFVNFGSKNCLDDSPSDHLRTFPCNGGDRGFQKWRQVRFGELMNEATGLCLDYSNQFHLRTVGCNAGFRNFQVWGS